MFFFEAAINENFESEKRKNAAEKSRALQGRKLDPNVTFPSFWKPGLAATEMSPRG